MNIIKTIKQLRYKLLIQLFRCIPIKKNKIIIWSDSFKSYGCNPKYISEHIMKNYPEEFDIVWVFDATLPVPDSIPNSVRIVRYFSKEYLYELHTSHFVICNARTSNSYFWKKRKNQVYIQTWHSSLRLKTIEKDASEHLPQNYIQAAMSDSKKIDYIISGCEFSTNIFKNSFWYSGKILECGTPRIDYLLNNSKDKDLYEKIGVSSEFKYVLYAPTFRNDKNFEYNFDFRKLTDSLEKKFAGKWRVLYRLHPNLTFSHKQSALDDVCINVSRYPDMQELMLVSDMLISDYSSCIFDAAYTKKPCILFMKDYDNYVKNERKLYFEITSLPFYKAYSENELFDELSNFDTSLYNQRINDFLNTIGSYENGDACQQIINLIKEVI